MDITGKKISERLNKGSKHFYFDIYLKYKHTLNWDRVLYKFSLNNQDIKYSNIWQIILRIGIFIIKLWY